MPFTENLRFFLLFILLISIFFLREYVKSKDRNSLRKKGWVTICTVTEMKERNDPHENYPVYTFEFNGKVFEGSGVGVISKVEFTFFGKKDIGKRYFMMFLPENPSVNSILPYNRPPDSLSNPQSGWRTLPIGKIEYPVP